jgi:hypothetical protein
MHAESSIYSIYALYSSLYSTQSICFMVTKFMWFTPLYHISIDIYTPDIVFYLNLSHSVTYIYHIFFLLVGGTINTSIQSDVNLCTHNSLSFL